MPSSWLAWAAVLIGCLVSTQNYGQEPSTLPTGAELKSLLDQQAAEIQDLRRRIDKRESIYEGTQTPSPACDEGPSVRRLPAVVEAAAPNCDEDLEDADYLQLDYLSDYDHGFLAVRPVKAEKHPFELKFNGWIQFRHHAFSSDVDSWTDNAGVTRPVRDRNAMDIERARLTLSGYAQDPRLTYFLQLDGDTDGGHAVDFFDYWWAWEFSEHFQLQLGKRKVAADRQWLLGARNTRFIDRPMANDFFRPDRTVGAFGVGKLGQSTHYEVMLGNGYNTTNLPNSVSDNLLTFAATNYFDPLGDYGGPLVDFSSTQQLLVRLGHSFVYSPQADNARGQPLEEADFIRLSDGTRLTQTGALAPGVTVSAFDVRLYGVDAAAKWMGWSLNSEIFFRWINEIQGDGVLPVKELYQKGFYIEGGRFLLTKLLDANIRYSQVSGEFSGSSEIAAGFNWYPLKKTNMKISFDVTAVDGSPLQSSASDMLVGDDGMLFRTQVQTEF